MFAAPTFITVNGYVLETMEKIYDDNTITVAVNDTNGDLLWWKNGTKRHPSKEAAQVAIQKELTAWAKLQVVE